MQAGKLRTTFAFALRRRVNPTENLSSQRIVLIDDVLTMCKTVSEVARILCFTVAEVIVAVLATGVLT